MIQALVFDLDDTLLNRAKRISPVNQEALRQCLDAGIQIVIATSRPKRAVIAFLEPEFVASCTLITLNGAVLEMGGRTEQFSRLGTEARRILEQMSSLDGASVSVEYLGMEFTTNVRMSDDELWRYHSATPGMLVPMDGIRHNDVSKIAVDGCGRSVQPFVDSIASPGVKAILANNGTFVNVVQAGIDKSSTLEIFAERSGLDVRRMVAFGDDIPDLGMMRLVGRSVAMANAIGDVKGIADTVIGDCDTDAIARYVRETLLPVVSM